MRMYKKIPLQFKILTLITGLIVMIILLLVGISSYVLFVDSRNQVEQLVLQTAKTIALMPELHEAIEENELEETFRPIAEQVKDQIHASNIVVENRETIIYSHTDPSEVGTGIHQDANEQVLTFGGSYNFEVVRENGDVLVGKVPIIASFEQYDSVIGTVAVEFPEENIYKNLYQKLKTILFASLVVLCLGIIGGVYLTKNIRKDTLGLEPHEIASLYRERNAILLSIKEGIVAINRQGIITMINHSAKNMLNLDDSKYIHKHISEVLPSLQIDQGLETGEIVHHAEVAINDKVFIFNFIPILENGQVIGVVASFTDKTELKKLVETLSEVREYSDGLRAQTHEYSNKLYLLSGLMQLERYQEALDFIQKESFVHQYQTKILFNQIQDPTIQAILLGKLGKASEKKIELNIDVDSYVDPLPDHIEITDSITIIGNLIDNAFEAVMSQKEKMVTFSIMGIGNEIIIEVTDNGPGISSEQFEGLFTIGSSTKGSHRGFGLFNVMRIVKALNGTIEVTNRKHGGAIFTVFLPKKIQNREGDNLHD